MKKRFMIGAMALVSSVAMASTYDASVQYTAGKEFNKGYKETNVVATTTINLNDALALTPSIGYRVRSDSDAVSKDGRYIDSIAKNGTEKLKEATTRMKFGLYGTVTPSEALVATVGVDLETDNGADGAGKSVVYYKGTKEEKRHAFESHFGYRVAADVNFKQDVNSVWFGLDVNSVDKNGRKDDKDSGFESRNYGDTSSKWFTYMTSDSDAFKEEKGFAYALGLGYTFSNEQLTTSVKLERFASVKPDNDTVAAGDGGYAGGDLGPLLTVKDDKDKVTLGNTLTVLDLSVAYNVNENVAPFVNLGYGMIDHKNSFKVPTGNKGKLADTKEKLSVSSSMYAALGIKGTF